MVFSGAFIFPHGSMILDPDKNDRKSLSLNKTLMELGKKIAGIDHDAIFLTTPHGISHSNDFGVYLNTSLEGNAEWEGKYAEYSIKVMVNTNLSEKYIIHLKENNCRVSGITCFSRGVPAIARWGEAVPLWFLKHLESEYIILSQPTRRYKQALEMVPELLKMGELTRNFLDSQDRKIIAVISADLAHTHDENGPYGFPDTAEVFDKLIEQWVNTLDQNILVDRVGVILNRALCCGFSGFVILQGMLKKGNWEGDVLVNEHPSYYGMMAASFTEKSH
ncbi:MAG: hypothetical protein ACTSRU_08520 [Candidatus Hodarchaeales archaeon]